MMSENLSSQIKGLSLLDLKSVAEEIRKEIILATSKNGGHLSSNLCIVEITMMIHRTFNLPTDKLLFDVGHQCYTHKILSGRSLETLRLKEGISGFQKREESSYDVFEAGHSSTSLSAALGMACARDLDHQNYEIIVVIGDGSISSGPSFEALNDLAHLHHKIIVVLNDNEMSISKPVGGTAKLFSKIRISSGYTKAKSGYQRVLKKTKFGRAIYRFTSKIKNAFKRLVLPSTYFEGLGIEYIGPIDGHDFVELDKTFKKAKKMTQSVIIHCLTTKGKGYPYAENDAQGHWHGVGPFHIEDGRPLKENIEKSWSRFYSELVFQAMEKDHNLVYLNPAMIRGAEAEDIYQAYPERAFDMGIAEEHAVSMASGFALNGKHPILAIYSTFLQRGIDQVNQDLCRMNLPCTLLIDRAGLVGADGETHHGIFEESFLLANPQMIVTMPATTHEAEQLFQMSLTASSPFAIRYPRASILKSEENYEISYKKWIWYRKNQSSTLIIGVGPLCYQLYKEIEKRNLDADVLNAIFLKPLDEEALKEVLSYETILLYSPYSTKEGWVEKVATELLLLSYQGKVKIHAIPTAFIKQSTIEEQLKDAQIDIDSILLEISK